MPWDSGCLFRLFTGFPVEKSKERRTTSCDYGCAVACTGARCAHMCVGVCPPLRPPGCGGSLDQR